MIPDKLPLDPNQCRSTLEIRSADGRSGVHFCDQDAGHKGAHGNSRHCWTNTRAVLQR